MMRTAKKRTIKTKHADEYREFLRSLQLVGIALIECRFRIDRERFMTSENNSICSWSST